jgi:hypothetical protein
MTILQIILFYFILFIAQAAELAPGDLFNDFLLLVIVPLKIYSNAEDQKALIIKENRGKPGVYR